jgi:hypothetical protein
VAEQSDKGRTLVSSLWVNYNMAPPAERCNRFYKRSDIPFRHLIDSLLIDDEVLVPTQDFMALPVFLRRLGGASFVELLESGCFKFVRFSGAIGYAGGGVGMIIFGIEHPDGRKRPITAPIAEAARTSVESVGMFADRSLISALEKATIELDVAETFSPIATETYRDVQHSAKLSRWFASRSQTFQNLTGIQSNQARIYGGPDVDWSGDEIDVLLALATANLELRMAEMLSCTNSASTSPVQEVINAKALRMAPSSSGFTALRQLIDIPDVGAGVLNNQIALRDLLKLRNKSGSQQFRKWFRQHRTDEPAALAKAFVSLLKEVPASESLPLRIIRYLVATAAGLVPAYGTFAGPAVTAVDSFLTDYLFRKRGALFFVDELKAFTDRAMNPKKTKQNAPAHR